LAIDMMVQLARNLEGLGQLKPAETAVMLDTAGFTPTDRRSFARLLQDCARKHAEDDTDNVTDQPRRFDKIAMGCLNIGSMANARRGTKPGAPVTKPPSCE
jgi:hypothetical protein